MSEPAGQNRAPDARASHAKGGARVPVRQGLSLTRASLPKVDSEGMPILPPWVAIFELTAFVLGVVILTWAYPGFDLNAVRPNPCWLPVLLLSLQYGTVSGLLAALSGIGLTLYAGLPDQEIGENYYAYLIRGFAEPMLWLGTAILVGQFRQRQIAAKRTLRRMVGELTQQRAALAEFSQNLRARCDRLERDIVGRPAVPVLRAFSMLAKARQGRAGELEADLAGLVAELPPGTRVSVYGETGGALKLLAATGGPQEDIIRPEMIGSTTPLYQAVITGRRSLSVLRAGDEALVKPLGLGALPIRSAGAGEPLGLLLIEAIPADGLEAEGLQGLSVIADALGEAIATRLSPAFATVTALKPAASEATGSGLSAPIDPAKSDDSMWANVRKRFSLNAKPATTRTSS